MEYRLHEFEHMLDHYAGQPAANPASLTHDEATQLRALFMQVKHIAPSIHSEHDMPAPLIHLRDYISRQITACVHLSQIPKSKMYVTLLHILFPR